MDPQTKQFLAEAGCKGGRAKSDRKRLAGKANAAKAREMKLLYRLNPELRPNYYTDALNNPFDEESSNGNKG